MKYFKLFEDWINEGTKYVIDQNEVIKYLKKSIEMENSQGFKEALEEFKEEHTEDAPGKWWSCMSSTASDERHYDNSYNPGYNLAEDGYKIFAKSAAAAALKMVMLDGGDSEQLYFSTGDAVWGKGGVDAYGHIADKQAEWFLDDGCVGGDDFHWEQWSITSMDDDMFNPKKLTAWADEELFKAFADNGFITQQEYNDNLKYVHSNVSGKQYGI